MLLRSRPNLGWGSATHSTLRARTLATSARAAGSRIPRFLYLRLLINAGLLSGAVLGMTAFVYDARAGLTDPKLQDERVQSLREDSSKPSSNSLSELLRTYAVFSFCSVPVLVDWAPSMLAALSAVPGLKQLTEAVVRATFFNQFVGGDTAEDALPLIEALRARNTGCLFAYSVEVDEAKASGGATDQSKGSPESAVAVHKQVVQETLHCIDVAADFEDKHTPGRIGRRTWVAIKLSAMVPDAEILRRFSKHLVESRTKTRPPAAFPGCPLPSDLDVLSASQHGVSVDQLTEADIAALRELRDDLVTICNRAKERGVRLIFDAEYTWYEPAIDAFTLDMMRKFNRLPKQSWLVSLSQGRQHTQELQPLIYATYQAYLRRTPEYLAHSIAAARKEGYSLGVKLVRGAYHPHELVAHPSTSATADASMASPSVSTSLSISPDPVPPVWTSKAETDERYNACVRTLVGAVEEDVRVRGAGNPPTIGVLFGTHNWESVNLIIEELTKRGLATADEDGRVSVGESVAERVTIGQLYGMTAALTSYLVERVRSPSPFVIKYIPYGRLSEVMPYLGRRAIENKSVLGNGGAVEERRRAAAELWARMFGGK
ncbi:FAD-linked oxidoreductase [Trametes coccinea BRFM310]|uniref:Proline dehydrogenase n=1 Tax=Trametes coccinea (strain BRFM310) TaxID=1353009 RepID=A0A1Y2IX61_TRAC3|nr:FAD-linked oxidoreductase [Trametes coccinea BRFM310]